LYRKNDFAEVESKNLAKYRSENNLELDHQNIESMMNNIAKSFNIQISANSSILHNYFSSPIKLFSDLCLTKFLDASAKSIFFIILTYF